MFTLSRLWFAAVCGSGVELRAVHAAAGSAAASGLELLLLLVRGDG